METPAKTERGQLTLPPQEESKLRGESLTKAKSKDSHLSPIKPQLTHYLVLKVVEISPLNRFFYYKMYSLVN